jgi:hypothetical protein
MRGKSQKLKPCRTLLFEHKVLLEVSPKGMIPVKKAKRTKTVVDNRLPALSRNDPFDYNLQPCCGVALPVAGATPRR